MIDPKEEIEFLRSLRAVRQFRSEAVPQDVIDDLLTVARWSGSSVNRQPWEFVVIRDKETLRALSEVGGYVKHLAGAALGIVLVMAGEHDVDETYDEGRLSERIMLAAKAHGVGACIGWFDPNDDAKAKAILGIPREKTVRTALSLGFPDTAAPRARARSAQPRKPLADIVHVERYGRRPA